MNKPLLQELDGERGHVSCLRNVHGEMTRLLVFWLGGTTAFTEGHGKVNTYVTFLAQMIVALRYLHRVPYRGNIKTHDLEAITSP